MLYFVKSLSNLNKKTFDLVELLGAFSFLQAILFVFFIFNYEWNKFCSQESLILGLGLLLQAFFVGQAYKIFNRPFILYFYFYLQTFYTLRILTLYIFSHSNVLERFPYHVTDTNLALIFIIFANFFLFFGYFLNLNRSKKDEIKKIKMQEVKIGIIKVEGLLNLICALLFTSIIIQTSGLLTYFYLNAPRSLIFISIFVTPNLFYVFLLPLIILFFKIIPASQKIFLSLLCLTYVTYLTLGGSRSAIYGLLEVSLISIFCHYAIEKKYLPIKKLSYLLFITPLFLIALFFTFKIGTVARNSGISLTLNTVLNYLNFQDLEQYLPAIFSRVGFFDFSSEVIAHENYYRSIFNFKTYLHSLVDNALTPGFDLFDQPKIGNSLSFIYNSLGNISKVTSSLPQFYQSDQIGIYGELFSLFGLFSLIVFFTVGLFIGFFENYILRTKGLIRLQFFTLFIFLISRFFNSFGLDWVLMDIITYVPILILLIFIEYKFFKLSIL